MTLVRSLCFLANQAIKINSKPHNFVPVRSLKFQVNLKWVHPEKPSIFHPSNTGDLVSKPILNKEEVKLEFQKSEELKTANENVKKIFSLKFQTPKEELAVYTQKLMNLVKRHPHDVTSHEVKIAQMTARIRFYQPKILEKKIKGPFLRYIKELIDRRKKKLKCLRVKDYRRFEWLLEKLELEYKPVPLGDRKITRKKSLVLLAKLKIEKEKEEKLAVLKKSYDEQKIPFLIKKAEKLRWIKEMEEKHNLPPSVTDQEIEECIQNIENVKIDLEEKSKFGYLRKIHPYFLEPYNEKLLKEKESNSSIK